MNLIFVIGGLVGDRMGVAIGCMLIAGFLPFFWAMLAKFWGGFTAKDNENPRAFLAGVTGKAFRANAVQANSFETLPMFLAGVLLAMHCFVPQMIVNGLACFYVLLRVVFGVAYVANWATLRSIFWVASMACVVMLFVLSIKMVG